MNHFEPCVVIPVFNHEHAVGVIVARLQATALPIILVDDGSEPGCAKLLEKLAQADEKVSLVQLPNNLGKGGAVKAGLREAQRLGFSHALQIDADGQHAVADVEQFLVAGRQSPQALICGCPIFDDSVPKHRFYARYLTHVWVWINSLSMAVKDSMCGFRLYPLEAVNSLIDAEPSGNRMEFDSEIMVRWVWRAGQVVNLPTRVSYPIDGVSHFAPWRDNLLISKMHATLFLGMLWRSPKLIWRKLTTQ